MLKLLKSGFYTTIQDGGRFGYLSQGVPVSGFMDSETAIKLNKLLENEHDTNVLEITMTGPTVLFETPSFICVGGAEMSVTLNNEPIENFKVYRINSGDILSYGKLVQGFRSYLAIKDGFKVESVLGSSSFYSPITTKVALKDLDEISYNRNDLFVPKDLSYKKNSSLNEHVLDV